MASYRIGIGSFNLKDGAVGIGTESTGLGNLKVEGTIKTTDLDVLGVSTLTRYSGFEAEQTNIIRDATYGDNEPVTYTVTVIGGIFYIDGVSAPILTLKRGTTYTFDQSANTNNGHPLRFKDGDGNSYSSGVVATGTPGSLEAKVTFVVPSNAPDDLRYYCTVHGNGMGNVISVVNQNSSNIQTTGDIVVDTGKTLTVGLGGTVCVGSVESISVKNHFSVPVGDTAGRDKSSGYAEGTVRYNRDLGTVEFFNGNEWRQFRYQSDTGNRGRGVIGGGHNYVSTIQAWEIATLGSAFMFGDLTNARAFIAGNVASETRGIFGGGRNPAVHTNRIDYVTIASQGNAIDFGDQSRAFMASGGMSSSTRGIFAGGYAPSLPDLDMEYIEIATLGNALDFGDLFTGAYYSGTVSSPVRGVYAGGNNPSGSVSTIQNLTIASLGNMVKFGDLTVSRFSCAGGGNSVRGIFCGGYSPYAPSGKKHRQTMDYVTIASEGNAITFGDAQPSATTGISQRSGSGSNQTRAVWAGGQDNSTTVNVMEYVTIATTGNTQDFGDLGEAQRAGGTLSDSHGGLGGY